MPDPAAEHHLSFRRMPVLLRILVLVMAGDGAIRIVRVLLALVGGEPTRLSGLTTGAVLLAAGVEVLRGQRRGIDWFVFFNLAVVGMLAYGAWRSGEAVTTSIVGTAALLLVVSGYLWWCRVRLPWQARGSFGQWMTDPEFRDAAAEWFAERDRQIEQDRRQRPDPDEVVRSLLEGADEELVRHRIQDAPEHYGMAVVRALADPAFRTDVEILAMLIDQLPKELHERARGSLVASLDHLTGYARGKVLLLLAESGDPALTERLIRELDGDEAEFVVRGLASAFAGGLAGDEVRRAFAPALRARLDRPGAPVGVSVALARLDPELPQQLTERAMASADDEPLRGLVAIHEAGIPLPTAAMLSLWRRARDSQQWYWCWRLLPTAAVPEPELRALLAALPNHFEAPVRGDGDADAARSEARYARLAYMGSIEQLVDRGCGDAEHLLEQAIGLDRVDISDQAAGRLLRFHGMTGDFTFHGVADPTPRQLALRSLALASSYAANGGIMHAFDCLDAACMAAFEPALHAIAPAAVRDIWLAACREVSPKPLPADPDARRALVMERYKAVKLRLDDLERQLYAINWQLDVAMVRHALAHRAELTPGS